MHICTCYFPYELGPIRISLGGYFDFRSKFGSNPSEPQTPVATTERDLNGVPQRDDDNMKISVYRLFLGWLVEGT